MSTYEQVKSQLLNNINPTKEAQVKAINLVMSNRDEILKEEAEGDRCRKIRELIEIIAIYYMDKKDFKFPDSVEDISSQFTYSNSGLLVLLGIAEETRELRRLRVLNIKSTLVKLGFYSNQISKTDIEIILSNIEKQGPFESYYLSDLCKNKEAHMNNIKEYVKDKIFPESVEDIDYKFIKSNSGILVLLGVTESYKEMTKLGILNIKSKLVNLGFYSNQISKTDIEIILSNIQNSNFESYYLSDLCKNKEAHMNNIREYVKDKIFPASVEDINSQFVNSELSILVLLGIAENGRKVKELGILNIKLKLVKLGLYSNQISETDIEVILRNLQSKSKNYYFSNLCENKNNNKGIMRDSELFQNYLKGVGVDGEKITNRSIKSGLKRLGFVDNISNREVNYRMVLSRWSEEDENDLLDLYREHTTNLKEYLHEDNPFGRSISAVMSKLNSMINERNEYKNEDRREFSKGFSTFPNSVIEYLHELISYSAVPIEEIKNQYPIITYYYPINGELTDESVYVCILPIEFKGIKAENYTPTQQMIIQFAQNKLAYLDENDLQEYEPRVLKIITPETNDEKGIFIHPKFELVGLYLRKKFSLNNELDTREFNLSIPYVDGLHLDMSIWWLQN